MNYTYGGARPIVVRDQAWHQAWAEYASANRRCRDRYEQDSRTVDHRYNPNGLVPRPRKV